MDFKTFSRLDVAFGWLCFIVAAATYWLTVEPSISFWDCPEYVACATKGEVGHPPGNSFFLLAGRVFANFAGGDMTQVALWINRMSALLSAGTILFLFWTITALVVRLWGIGQCDKRLTRAQGIVTLGCGVVGALAYTWSDTFWFSAVEAEVYAFSSFMTALTFWLILKWEQRADQPSADRYIILIAYVVGLSIGVHLLNLLCLPAIVLVCCFRRRRHPGWRGIVLSVGGSMLLIALILFGIIPGVVWLAQRVELLMVNGCGLPYNSGALTCYATVLLALVAALCKVGRSSWRHRRTLSVALWSLLMLLVGYSTFAQVIIRSVANAPINENAPDNVFALSRYLNREQYGQTPLLWGQTFASAIDNMAPVKDGRPLYAKAVKRSADEPDRYCIYDHTQDFRYDYAVFFPRMFSSQPQHIAGYRQWSGYKGEKVTVRLANGRTKQMQVPTWSENMTYFFRYQVNYMYWRYFLWNFCGRQNDLRGNGEADRGNWITGIPSVDEFLVGNQHDQPRMITSNKGHNVYYMLPLLLGLTGIVWQFRQGKNGRQGFLVVLLLFVMTGLAIVVYLNQTPNQPRERDYAYAGSFYAFAIWIGMGVAGVASAINKALKNRVVANASAVAISLCVPLQMVGQTWNDHDRSDRYMAHDFGQNYLTSLAPNAIVFVSGDNETFPLWYAQEVEGYRRDVRVCNLAYLQTDWYIDQMKSPAYESAPLPIPFRPEQYAGNKLCTAYIIPRTERPVDMHQAMNFLYSDDARYKTVPNYGQRIDYLPAKTLQLSVDADAVLQSDCIAVQPGDSILPQMSVALPDRRYLVRNEIVQLALLDSIARDGWHRPIYYAATVGPDSYVEPYLRYTGLAQQVVPLANATAVDVDNERMYDNLMHRFKWGNADKPGIYIDETTLGLCITHRMVFGRLIEALLAVGDKHRALSAAERCLEVLPPCNVPHDISSLPIVRCLLANDKIPQAMSVADALFAQADEYLHWAFGLDDARLRSCSYTLGRQLYAMKSVLGELERFGQSDAFDGYFPKFQHYYEQYQKHFNGR
ncbi:MAG: DUF2723 domain-containing protein [Bacteroidales bacterium]|nr:DUF2723 domain-containing protein [Bacteroidales bacterium]